MSNYFEILFEARQLSSEYRAAITQLFAAYERVPEYWNLNKPIQEAFPDCFSFMRDDSIYQHPFFQDERWHDVIRPGRGIDKGQPRLLVKPAGDVPEIKVAARVNYGGRTIALFLFWICPGVQNVRARLTDETDYIDDFPDTGGAYFAFEGEVLTPADLTPIEHHAFKE